MLQHYDAETRQRDPASRPDEPQRLPDGYHFCPETDLTVVMKDITQGTYANHVREYVQIERDEATVAGVWKHIINPLATILKPNLEVNERELVGNGKRRPPINILVAGSGPGRDTDLLALMRKEFQVYAFDLVTQMVDAADAMRKWEEIRFLALFLQANSPADTKYWVHGWLNAALELDQNFAAVDDDGNPDTVIDLNKIITSIRNRVHTQVADMRNLENVYETDFFDLILNVGNFPHLSKMEIVPTILGMMEKLKVGGILSFDLKIDADRFFKPGAKGRVWCDNAIGGDRYFATYTRDEIEELAVALAEFGYELEYQMQDGEEMFAPHVDAHKPQFARFLIRKKAKPVISPSGE